jgi:saccharopine dehydrogenase-like NADP-dependent oxidoreductase
MGQVAVRILLQNKAINHVIVADNDAQRLKNFVESLATERISARVVDVGNEAELVDLIRKGDVVINTTGPFYRYGLGVVRAAIEAQRNYADINDDWKPTQDALVLDDKAKAAGVSVVVGIGASPGLTNLLAKHAANQLDRVDAVHTAWSLGSMRPPQGEVPVEVLGHLTAATVHFLHCASGKIPTFRDGKFVYITPLEETENVTWPTGRVKFYHIGHAEPVTLPHFIKGVKHACNLFGGQSQLVAALRELARKINNGELTAFDAAGMLTGEVIRRFQEQPEVAEGEAAITGGLLGSAEGMKGDKRVRYGYSVAAAPEGDMGGITGVPLAIATEMLLEGTISAKGVVAPEACIDPVPFFEKYRKYCVPPPEEGKVLLEVVEELG